ncbi:MAG: S-layer homology domain-containing protein, partial [Acidimicrobiia bacterium]|nr:S-layer homology domain-containing protein [Acidimicrobiia bacterium]
DGAGLATAPCQGEVPPAGFTDVAASSVHAADIDCVAHVGVTTGVGNGLFDPKGTVTRWQMALFLARTAPLLGIEVPVFAPQFTDLQGLSPEAVAAIGSLQALGITSGTTATTYSPGQPVTRWQMALFLTRLHSAAGYELPPGLDQGFTDISTYPSSTIMAINQLAELGITSGTSPTTYGPGANVLREQMASFLARLIRIDGLVQTTS